MDKRTLVLAAALAIAGAGVAHAGTVESLFAKSKAAESRGDIEAATRFAQAAVVAAPARGESYVALADLYARHGDPASASHYYGEALFLDPADPDAQKGLALAESAKPTTAAAGSLDNNDSQH